MAASTTDVLIPSRWHLPIRVLWWALVGALLLATLVTLPMQAVSLADAERWSDPAYVEVLATLNLTPGVMALVITLTDALLIAVYSGVGLVLYLRRADSLLVALLALMLVTSAPTLLTGVLPVETWAGALVALNFFSYLFPDGRFVPGWTRPVSVLTAAAGVVLVLISQPAFLPGMDNTAFVAGYALLTAPVALAQFTRYRQHMNHVQRQQTRWVLLGGALTFLTIFGFYLLTVLFPALNEPGLPRVLGYWVIGYPTRALLLCVLPFCLAFAVLRHRLWDVPLVVNRSLVYGIVAVVLAVLYVFDFLVTYSVSNALFGVQNAAVPLALSTGVNVLIYNPLRRAVQRWIDRTVFRLKFDLNQLAQAQKDPEVKNPGALTGKTLGHFKVQGVLGKGGMGEVYKGVDLHTALPVALKILPAAFADNAESQQRFRREAEALRKLRHPNIITFVDSGETDGVPYLALEFVDGMDLSAFLRQQGVLEYGRARSLLRDVATALDFAHARGVIHRDVKPSNVLVRRNNVAVLTDFGIARLRDAGTRLTFSGAMGTIDYMAPEQILAAREVDQRADVYALAVTAFEMLTGETPFKGGAAQVMFAHLQQPPPDARTVRADVPERAALALLRGLAKRTEDRYDTAGEFVAAL